MRKGGKSHMELDDLLKLIDHVSKSKLDDFCYETGEIKLRLKKNAAKEIVVQQKAAKNAAPEFAIVQNCEDVFDADTSKRQMKHHLTNILILLLLVSFIRHREKEKHRLYQ